VAEGSTEEIAKALTQTGWRKTKSRYARASTGLPARLAGRNLQERAADKAASSKPEASPTMRPSATLPLSAIVTSTRTVTEPTAFGG
jgi:hypothetical protein